MTATGKVIQSKKLSALISLTFYKAASQTFIANLKLLVMSLAETARYSRETISWSLIAAPLMTKTGICLISKQILEKHAI